MEPYQERVVQEKAELDDKIDKLDYFIGKEMKYGALPAKDRRLLQLQLAAMSLYSDILTQRIAAFDLN
jgi:hypothetical protein